MGSISLGGGGMYGLRRVLYSLFVMHNLWRLPLSLRVFTFNSHPPFHLHLHGIIFVTLFSQVVMCFCDYYTTLASNVLCVCVCVASWISNFECLPGSSGHPIVRSSDALVLLKAHTAFCGEASSQS